MSLLHEHWKIDVNVNMCTLGGTQFGTLVCVFEICTKVWLRVNEYVQCLNILYSCFHVHLCECNKVVILIYNSTPLLFFIPNPTTVHHGSLQAVWKRADAAKINLKNHGSSHPIHRPFEVDTASSNTAPSGGSSYSWPVSPCFCSWAPTYHYRNNAFAGSKSATTLLASPSKKDTYANTEQRILHWSKQHSSFCRSRE